MPLRSDVVKQRIRLGTGRRDALSVFEGHRHAADVLFVAQVLQKIAVDRGHAIFEHVLVEREYLARDVCAEMLRVLQEHAAHDDLDLRAILLADQVLAVAPVSYTHLTLPTKA